MNEPQPSQQPQVAYAVPKSDATGAYVVVGVVVGVFVILPVVVAILGILAAIAIPNFVRYQQRSKSVEAKRNVTQLALAEAAYFNEHDRYLVVPVTASQPGEQALPFRANDATRALGFDPGPVARYAYEVEVEQGGRRAIVHAWGDLDGDGAEAEYRIELSRGEIGALQEPKPGVY